MPLSFVLLAALWAGWLSAEDLRRRRLPNAWTLGGLLAFLAFHAGYGGAPSAVAASAAAALAGLFLLPAWLMRAAGGGDVKMLAAAGAAAGPSGVLPLLLHTSVAGLVVALAWLAAGRADPARLRHLGNLLFNPRYDRAAGAASLPDRGQEKVRVPFALAIALGLLGALWTTRP